MADSWRTKLLAAFVTPALPTGAATEAKQDTAFTQQTAIKDAAELVSVTSRLAGSLSNLVRGIHVLGHDGTNFRTLLTDAAGNLIPKSPTAADFKVEEASAASILANQTNDTQITQVKSPLKRIAFSKANDDGTAIALATGVNSGTWELVSVRLIQSGGASTTSQYAIAEIAGAAPPDTNTVFRASAATAKGTLVPDSFVEPIPCLADASGELHLFSGRDAADDSTVAGVVYLRRAVAL